VSTALITSFSAAGQLLAMPAALAAPLLMARLGLGRTVVLGYQRFFFVAAALTASGGLLFWAYFRVPRGELAHSASLKSL
jgi:hypothetical protein